MIPKLFRGKLRQSTFELILSNPGINSDRIAEIQYANDPEGGVESSAVIRTRLLDMKPTLERNEYVLDSVSGPGGGYTLRTQEPV